MSDPQRKQGFIDGVKRDIAQARKLQKGSVRYKSDLNAAYHCRKHGDQFAAEPKVYFKDIPQELFQSDHLAYEYLAKVEFIFYSIGISRVILLGWKIDLFRLRISKSRWNIQRSIWCVIDRSQR